MFVTFDWCDEDTVFSDHSCVDISISINRLGITDAILAPGNRDTITNYMLIIITNNNIISFTNLTWPLVLKSI